MICIGRNPPSHHQGEIRMLGFGVGLGLPQRHAVSIDTRDQTVALFGDSISAQNTGVATRLEAYGYLTTLNVLSGQRYIFNHALNKGVSGNSTTQMAARLSDLDGLGATIVMVHGGTNDVIGEVSSATIIANLSTVYSYIVNTLGARVVAIPILPRATWPGFSAGQIATGKATINTVNAWIRAQASAKIIVADPYERFNDGNDEAIGGAGNAAGAYTYDGLHPTLLGAYHMGKVLYDKLLPYYGTRSFSLSANNILTNTDFSGTGGPLSNATGQLADTHTLATSGTTNNATRTLSKYNGGQRVQCSFGSGLSTTEAARILQTVNSSSIDGMNAYYEVELEVLGGSGNPYTLSAQLNRNGAEASIGYDRRDNATNLPAPELQNFTLESGRRLLLRSPVVTLAASTTSVTGRINIECNCVSAASSLDVLLHREQLVVY